MWFIRAFIYSGAVFDFFQNPCRGHGSLPVYIYPGRWIQFCLGYDCLVNVFVANDILRGIGNTPKFPLISSVKENQNRITADV